MAGYSAKEQRCGDSAGVFSLWNNLFKLNQLPLKNSRNKHGGDAWWPAGPHPSCCNTQSKWVMTPCAVPAASPSVALPCSFSASSSCLNTVLFERALGSQCRVPSGNAFCSHESASLLYKCRKSPLFRNAVYHWIYKAGVFLWLYCDPSNV